MYLCDWAAVATGEEVSRVTNREREFVRAPGGFSCTTGRDGEPKMTSKIFALAAGLGFAVAANAPAKAQFMSSPYPVIIVPPPPAQNLILPKPAPERAERPKTPPPPPSSSPPNLGNCYQGRTNVCQ